MYIRSSYENMIESLGKFSSLVYVAQSNIQTSCSVMSRAMEDDDEGKETRDKINALCISIAELTHTADSVAASLREEIERIERETAQRMAGD